MDGLTATRRIRARSDEKAHLPIAIITADAALDLPDQCKAAGADDLIRKPINMGGLHDSLGRLLAKAGGGGHDPELAVVRAPACRPHLQGRGSRGADEPQRRRQASRGSQQVRPGQVRLAQPQRRFRLGE